MKSSVVKKILILVENYPSSEDRYPMAYVHTRVLAYLRSGEVEPTVLSFRAKASYVYEGVKVKAIRDLNGDVIDSFSKIVSHAPNLKNHMRFILGRKLRGIIFFIHGHEVLRVNRYYPKSYAWLRASLLQKFIREIYDAFKLYLLRFIFARRSDFSFVFVSKWMERETHRSLNLKTSLVSQVIHNPVNDFYMNWRFDAHSSKDVDFITVRPLDGAKYCVDLVIDIARAYPNFTFKIIGKGRFFDFVQKPDNLTWVDAYFSPTDLALHLDRARVALMPTRLDAQGVMVCELAASGMPVISSDIDVVKEMLADYQGAFFVDNENAIASFGAIIDEQKIFHQNFDPQIIRARFNNLSLTTLELNTILK